MNNSDINTLFFGTSKAENIANFQDTGGQTVTFHQWKDQLSGIQIGNVCCGDTSQQVVTSFTLPPDGTFTLLELMSKNANIISYISVGGQPPCGSNNYTDPKLMVNLKVRFASIYYKGSPGQEGYIRAIGFTIVA